MRKARIYRPAKTAMQSGRAKTQEWLLEFEPVSKEIDPIMGWTSSADTLQQLRMVFATQEEAEAYAKKHKIPYEVEQPHVRTLKLKSYASNFAFDRVETYVASKQSGKKSS